MNDDKSKTLTIMQNNRIENEEIEILISNDGISFYFKKNNKGISLAISTLEKAIDEFTKNMNFHYITKTEQNDKEKP